MTQRIPATLIPGDGIGPEIVDASVAVLDALGAPFDWDSQAHQRHRGHAQRLILHAFLPTPKTQL